jgi:phosphate/phosphite/phosphonate ABC transporter binding protein
VFGLLPVFAPDQMVRQFSPLASYLGHHLDTTMELRLTETYDEMLVLIEKGEIDLAQLSPFMYVTAKQKVPQIELIATNIAEGSSTYSGYIVARTDLGVSSIEDLKGLRFGFVDEHSASGFLYPSAFLISGGLNPERDFREIVFAGRHDSLMNHLIAGRIDAGATFSGALLNAEDHGLDVEQVQIVAKTGRIPYDAWVTRGDLHPSVVAKLQSRLLALSTRDRQGRRILRPLRSINAFAPITDAHYDQVRAVKTALERARK